MWEEQRYSFLQDKCTLNRNHFNLTVNDDEKFANGQCLNIYGLLILNGQVSNS